MRRRVAIVGGGISGLSAAHRLLELDPALDLLLLEAENRLGGVLHTAQRDGFLVESAADNFLTSPPAAVNLCRRLGLEEALIAPDAARRQALVVRGGQLLPVPQGFILMAPSRLWPLITTPTLTVRGKLRAAAEYFLPNRADRAEDESLQSFVSRRFGREVFERLVEPLIGSIYTADPQRLSVEATFPRFRQMERQHGSLLRAMLRQRRTSEKNRAGHHGSGSENGGSENGGSEQSSGARYGQFATLRGGIGTLVQALEQRLPEECVRRDSPAVALQLTPDDRWLLATGGPQAARYEVDGVILATPAHHACQLLTAVDAALADELAAIEYSSCAVIALGYRRDQIGDPLNGFGFVVPQREERMILSCSFASIKYAGRAPDDAVLLRVYVGGSRQRRLLGLSDGQLLELAEDELAQLLRIQGPPVLREVMRQEQAMPQYHVGHLQRLARINQRLSHLPSLALASSALGGVGLPSCIQNGEAAAESVLSGVRKEKPRPSPSVCA